MSEILQINGCGDTWLIARFESEAVLEKFFDLHARTGLGSAYGRCAGWQPNAMADGTVIIEHPEQWPTTVITTDLLDQWANIEDNEELIDKLDGMTSEQPDPTYVREVDE